MRIIVLKLLGAWLSCEQFFVGYHWDIMKPSVQDNSYDGMVSLKPSYAEQISPAHGVSLIVKFVLVAPTVALHPLRGSVIPHCHLH